MTATILVVDDNASLRTRIRQILVEADLDVQLVEAEDGAQALPLALSGDVDIVLSDIVMPNLDGITLLRSIRQQRDLGALPVILVTSQAETDTRNTSFEAGASDYLTRPFSPIELVTRVQVQLRLKALQRELQRANERHRRLTVLDELTGLSNRRFFLDECRRELARSRRHKLSMAVCILDIDDLRGINTRVGPRAADAIIADMAGVLRRLVRAADVLARFTGGKFAICLPHTEAGQAVAAAQRIHDTLTAHAFPGHEVGQITVSGGTASYPGGGCETVEELLDTAERGLDRAKGRGGNCVEGGASEPAPPAPSAPSTPSDPSTPPGESA